MKRLLYILLLALYFPVAAMERPNPNGLKRKGGEESEEQRPDKKQKEDTIEQFVKQLPLEKKILLFLEELPSSESQGFQKQCEAEVRRQCWEMLKRHSNKDAAQTAGKELLKKADLEFLLDLSNNGIVQGIVGEILKNSGLAKDLFKTDAPASNNFFKHWYAILPADKKAQLHSLVEKNELSSKLSKLEQALPILLNLQEGSSWTATAGLVWTFGGNIELIDKIKESLNNHLPTILKYGKLRKKIRSYLIKCCDEGIKNGNDQEREFFTALSNYVSSNAQYIIDEIYPLFEKKAKEMGIQNSAQEQNDMRLEKPEWLNAGKEEVEKPQNDSAVSDEEFARQLAAQFEEDDRQRTERLKQEKADAELALRLAVEDEQKTRQLPGRSKQEKVDAKKPEQEQISDEEFARRLQEEWNRQ